MPCEAERAAIGKAPNKKAKGKALQAYMKCKHKVEFMMEQEQQHERECHCEK